jgi:CheY-like chemotaxis protein
MKPELLVKLLIFETYYPQFTSKFNEVGEGENPIQGFLQFNAAREALRGGRVDDPAVSEVFEAYKISRPSTAEAALDLLNKEADERFVLLIGDGSFVSLVRSIPDQEDQQQILEKVRRRKELGTAAVPTAAVKNGAPNGSTPTATPDLARKSILWIDSNPENIEGLAKRMREAGADVAIASDDKTAEQMLQTLKPDLLISDIGATGGPPDVGFGRLEHLRSKDLYSGPVVFYTTRLSAARRARATELDAAIVSGEDDLFQALTTVFPSRPHPGESPAGPDAA